MGRMKRVRNLPSGRRYTVALIAALGAAIVGFLGSAPPLAQARTPGCGGSNWYAYAGGGPFGYGVRGYIKSSNQTIGSSTLPNPGPRSTQHFSAYVSTGDGVEIGWMVGYAPHPYQTPNTPAWYISPHAYVTLDGTHEIDGPAVGQTTDWYSVYWDGSNEQYLVRTIHGGGTVIWQGSQPASMSQAGQLFAGGETTAHTRSDGTVVTMSGTLSGDKPPGPDPIEYYTKSSSGWQNWDVMGYCADAGYWVTLRNNGDGTGVTDGTGTGP